LHARAALWSLTRALQLLTVAAHAHAQAQADSADLGTLQAWRPGTGGRSSGHGDALLEAVVQHSTGRTSPYADRHARTVETARWVARSILRDRHVEGVDPLVQLRQAVPAMTALAADSMRRWIEDEDSAVRRLLGEPDDRQPVAAIACPGCDTAGSLALRTSAPERERVVVCTTQTCACLGSGCPCGMGRQDAGAQHVWTIHEARAITDYGPKPADRGEAA